MAQKYPNYALKPSGGDTLDAKEREKLIVEYAYLVKMIARKMAVRLPSSVSVDELISAGCLGLIDAIDKYNSEKEVSLKTYAQYRIKGAILDELRNMDWYSRSMRKKIQNVEKAIKAVEFRESRPAEDLEVANELGMDLEKYFEMLSDIHSAALLSMDVTIQNDNDDASKKTTFQDQMRSKDDPIKKLDKQELKAILASAIKRLTQKEQMTISLYYYDELTLKEIGTVLGLTESRICQIHTTALIKMRTRLKDYQGG